MSLATRCTACGTIFRVVQDQLRVSEGWVRCGRCAEVFDAREQLFDIDREAPPSWPAPAMPAPAAPAALIAPEPPPAPPVWTSAPTPLSAPPPAPIAEPAPMYVEDEPEPVGSVESAFDIVAPAADEEPIRQEPQWVDDHPIIEPPAPLPAAAVPQDYGTDTILAPGLAEAAAAAAVDESEETPASTDRKKKPAKSKKAGKKLDPAAPNPQSSTTPAASPVPEFMRRAQRNERWRRPGVRIALASGCIAALAMLGAQVVLQFHDAIAAVYPSSRGAMEAACNIAGCKLEPWRRIDAIGVEASALNQAGPNNQYQLSLSLRNKSGLEVAAPWVELSLTDAAGATVSRRMLAPTEFKGGKPAMAPGAEMPLQLLMSTGEQRVAGYTVEIFHP